MVMPQPVTAMPSDNLTPTQLCSSVYPPDTLVLQQQQMQYNHPDILRHNLNNSIDQCVTLLQENSSMLFCSEDTMTKTAWHPPVKLLDQCDGLNHQTVCQGQHQTDLKQLDHCTEPLLQINVASKQSETLLVSPLQMNTPLLHMNNNVLPQLQNNEPNQCLDSNVYPQQFSEHLVPVSSVTPHSLSILPSQQNASVPQSNTNYQHDIDAIFASSETISISENEVPEIQDDSSEDIINAHFLVDYMTFRGKIDADDPDFKQLLEISNQRDRNEALLNHVLHSECEALDEALAHYHVYSEQFQDIITGVLSLESTLNIQRDQAYSSLTWEQVEGLVSSLFCKFLTDPTENSSNEVAFGYQYSLYVIGRMFSTEIVEKIGDYLSELEYARLAVSILRKIKPHQVFERSNELALSGITLCICIIYSGVSRLFALSLAHNGMVDTLTAHITESCIINNLTEKYMENMMTDFLRLIKNMAYHCEDKQHFKDSKTSEHVKRLPIRNNENVEIIVILILLNTLDEKEFNKLPDETKAIESMIKYMHRAIENKDTRSFHGISLCELTNGISKLALKFHKINMTHKVEVLSALCKMLHHTDPKEHISSSICLRALMSEADIRMKLKEFPQILSAMEGLMRNSSISVRKYVEEALKPIHFCMSDDTGEEKEKRVLFHNTEFSEGPISVDVQASGVANAVVCPTAYHHQKCVNPELKMLLQNQDLLTPETGLSHITQVPLITNYFVNVQYNKIKNAVKQEEKFTAKGKSEKIKPEDEDKVLKNWEYLLEELDATHIVDSMFAKKIFDLNDKREIIEPASRQKRTEILLKKLLNAGPGPAFETFITVLEADHSHIAKKLTETL
ncbi:unnamed protein product [Lymnaea stagnalis]|uniref:CARD domain-containing protein n=1 Tax=Lymnaea stagnalis TaxID=6523 RepID=A0AAV2HFE2_LYMST